MVSRGQRLAVLLALILAAGGFSFAIATGTSGAALPAGGASSRAIGSVPGPLRFLNPLLGDCRDLGDAAPGFPVERYARADGGTPPYIFKDVAFVNLRGSLIPSLSSASNNTLTLLNNGLLTAQGGVLSAQAALGADRFGVMVADSLGSSTNSVTECFQIRVVDGKTFRFAVSALPDGVIYRSYAAKAELIGGTAPYQFTVGAISGPGSPRDLGDIGLNLNPRTGLIFGKPTVSGAFTLTLTAIDSNQQPALSRFDSTNAQVLTLNIGPGTLFSSDLVSTSITIKGNSAKPGKDSIRYSGIVNLAGKLVTAIDSIQLNIGGYSTPVIPLNQKSFSVNGARYSASLNSSGLVKITVSNESFGIGLGGSKTKLAVGVRAGAANTGSEMLQFTRRGGAGAAYTLSYSLGPNNLAGAFMLTSVTGKDLSAGPADSWNTAFVALPPAGQNFTTANAAVDIGSASTTSLLVITNFNNNVGQKLLATGPFKSKLQMNASTGRGSFTISTVSSTKSNIPMAADFAPKAAAINPSNPNGYNFAIGVRLDNYSGSDSIFLYPAGKRWTSKGKSK